MYKIDGWARLEPEVKKWIDENQDSLSEGWTEYCHELSYEDNPYYIGKMYANPDCFYEWCEEIYYKNKEEANK